MSPEFCPDRGLRLLDALGNAVTLVVGQGKEQKSFVVHRNLLCKANLFFDTACKPQWMTPENQTINLPDEEPEIIRVMVYWMYEEKICVPADIMIIDEAEAMSTLWSFLIKLYILGDKYQMPQLCNDAIDGLAFASTNWTEIDFGVVSYVYEKTTAADCPLRRLWVVILLENNKAYESEGSFFEWKDRLCKEFLSDIACFLLEDVEVVRASHDSCARFHVHESGHEKCAELKEYMEY